MNCINTNTASRSNWTLLLLLATTSLWLAGCRDENAGHMTGTLERDRVELAVESNEPILAIPVADGEWVQAGTVVLQQDPARADALLRELRAQAAQAAARLAELRRGPRPEQIAEARSRLKAQGTLTTDARLDYERARDLYERGLGAEATKDRSLAALENSRAEEQALQDSLEALLNGTTLEELQQAEAVLEAAEAAVARAELDRARLTLSAPMDGLLDKVWFEVGERPAPGTTVAVLLDNARPYARIYVPEALRAQVVPGTRMRVAPDGVAAPLEGTVRWVSADATFTPYFALTEHDRGRLSFLAEIDLPGAAELPTGLPLEAWLPNAGPTD